MVKKHRKPVSRAKVSQGLGRGKNPKTLVKRIGNSRRMLTTNRQDDLAKENGKTQGFMQRDERQ